MSLNLIFIRSMLYFKLIKMSFIENNELREKNRSIVWVSVDVYIPVQPCRPRPSREEVAWTAQGPRHRQMPGGRRGSATMRGSHVNGTSGVTISPLKSRYSVIFDDSTLN